MNEQLHCPGCNGNDARQELAGSLFVCPKCGFHFRMEPYIV